MENKSIQYKDKMGSKGNVELIFCLSFMAIVFILNGYFFAVKNIIRKNDAFIRKNTLNED